MPLNLGTDNWNCVHKAEESRLLQGNETVVRKLDHCSLFYWPADIMNSPHTLYTSTDWDNNDWFWKSSECIAWRKIVVYIKHCKHKTKTTDWDNNDLFWKSPECIAWSKIESYISYTANIRPKQPKVIGSKKKNHLLLEEQYVIWYTCCWGWCMHLSCQRQVCDYMKLDYRQHWGSSRFFLTTVSFPVQKTTKYVYNNNKINFTIA